MKGKQFGKKMAAVLTAGTLCLSTSGTVWAADSYQEAEKAVIEALAADMAENLDKQLAEYDTAVNGSRGDLTLSLGEGGAALLSAAVPMDLSWLKSLSLNSDVSVADGIDAVDMKVLLNDLPLFSALMYIDMESLTEYIQLPEFSESYLAAPIELEVSAEGAQTSSGMSVSPDFMKKYMEIASDPAAAFPDGTTLKEILTRYAGIVISKMQEGDSVQETLTEGGISEETTMYEGRLYEDSTYEIGKEILTTARDDEQLKTLIGQWAEASDTPDMYEQFQSAVNDALEDMGEAPAETGEEYISSRIWLNGEDKVVGRQISFFDGTNENVYVVYRNVAQEGTTGFRLEMAAGTADESISVTGTGARADDVVSGDYTLSVNSVPAAKIHVDDLTMTENGYGDGTITVTFEPGPNSEQSAIPLDNVQLVVNMVSDAEQNTQDIMLTVSLEESELATLKISGGYGDGVEIPDLASLDSVCDVSSEEDMTSYVQGIKWDTFLDNVAAAGVPEELVSQLQTILESATSVQDTTPPAEGAVA